MRLLNAESIADNLPFLPQSLRKIGNPVFAVGSWSTTSCFGCTSQPLKTSHHNCCFQGLGRRFQGELFISSNYLSFVAGCSGEGGNIAGPPTFRGRNSDSQQRSLWVDDSRIELSHQGGAPRLIHQ
jgi:hypothetical protein